MTYYIMNDVLMYQNQYIHIQLCQQHLKAALNQEMQHHKAPRKSGVQISAEIRLDDWQELSSCPLGICGISNYFLMLYRWS